MRYRPLRTSQINTYLYLLGMLFFFFLTCSADAQALLQMGAQAPDFSLKDLDGKDVALSDFNQKKAQVILFWSTWSANSGNALKRFQEFHNKYADRGIQIIGVNEDNQHISTEDIDGIRKFTNELGISFPLLVDKGLTTFHGYGIIALPSTVVITDGKISYELPGFPLMKKEDMFDYLLVLAGEQPKRPAPPKYEPVHAAIADTNLARGFVAKKMYAMAYPFFTKAIEKDRKYMLPYVEMAKLYASEGKDTEAGETFRKALSIEPENVVVLSEFGYHLTKTGKIKEALVILEKAAKLNSYTPSHYYYAYALGKNGQTREALDAFSQAVGLNPFESTTYLLRAEVYEDRGLLKEAASDYRKALELLLKIRKQADSPSS